eukprot:8724418-Pyramimonas_sp.AAC.1
MLPYFYGQQACVSLLCPRSPRSLSLGTCAQHGVESTIRTLSSHLAAREFNSPIDSSYLGPADCFFYF